MEVSMLYDSDAFVVCSIETPPPGGVFLGFEIVDKRSNTSLFLYDQLANGFHDQIQRWKENTPEQHEVESVLASYCEIAYQPLIVH